MKLSVVIPAYNEEDSIEKVIAKVRNDVPGCEIIVVNDGSRDNTGDVAKSQNVKVITHNINRGYGASLKTGLKSVNSEYAAFIDADLTYDPKYILKFLKHAEEEKLDCVWGNRFGGDVNEMPLIRKIGNKLIGLIFFLATFKKVNDCSSGERLLRKGMLEKIDIETLPDDLEFITALTKRVVSRKLRYREIPINYKEREGSSKLNVFRHGYKMIKSVIFEK